MINICHPSAQAQELPWVKVDSRQRFSAVLHGEKSGSQTVALPPAGSKQSGPGHLPSGLWIKSIMEAFSGMKAQPQPPWCSHPAMWGFQGLLIACLITALAFLTGVWPQLYLVDSKQMLSGLKFLRAVGSTHIQSIAAMGVSEVWGYEKEILKLQQRKNVLPGKVAHCLWSELVL